MFAHVQICTYTCKANILGNRDEEGREMGSWKAVEIRVYINACRASTVYSGWGLSRFQMLLSSPQRGGGGVTMCKLSQSPYFTG